MERAARRFHHPEIGSRGEDGTDHRHLGFRADGGRDGSDLRKGSGSQRDRGSQRSGVRQVHLAVSCRIIITGIRSGFRRLRGCIEIMPPGQAGNCLFWRLFMLRYFICFDFFFEIAATSFSQYYLSEVHGLTEICGGEASV